MNPINMTTFRGTPIENIIRNLPEVDETINEENIRIFDEQGIYNSAEDRHTCVLCKNKTCIDNSISSEGRRLICVPCVYRHFDGDYAVVCRWCRKEV